MLVLAGLCFSGPLARESWALLVLFMFIPIGISGIACFFCNKSDIYEAKNKSQRILHHIVSLHPKVSSTPVFSSLPFRDLIFVLYIMFRIFTYLHRSKNLTV